MADWQPGDRAMCISGPPWTSERGQHPGPTLYSVHPVRDVVPGIFPAPEGAPFLEFHPWPGLCFWHVHFVKVEDDSSIARLVRRVTVPEPVG